MGQSTAKGERITAIVSTLVAAAILAAGVTAQQQHTAPRDELVQLESDLRFQLGNLHRHDTSAGQKRLAQLEQVVAAWKQAPRTANNRKLLAQWLLESTVRSMPGTVKDLQEVPSFDVADPGQEAAADERGGSDPQAFSPRSAPDRLVSNATGADFTHDTIPRPSSEAQPTQAGPAGAVAAAARPYRRTVGALERAPSTENSIVLPKSGPAANESTQPARINLSELAARVARYHERLDKIDTRLLKLGESDLAILAELTDDLDALTRDFRVANLYYNALSARERRSIESPRSLRATLREIERQIKRSKDAHQADFLSDFESDDQASQAEQLRQQLKTIAGRVDW